MKNKILFTIIISSIGLNLFASDNEVSKNHVINHNNINSVHKNKMNPIPHDDFENEDINNHNINPMAHEDFEYKNRNHSNSNPISNKKHINPISNKKHINPISKKVNKSKKSNEIIDKEKDYKLLLKLLTTDENVNDMNLGLSEEEIAKKKAEMKKKEEEKIASENKAYNLRETNRQKKLLPNPIKAIIIGKNRVVFANYTIKPYIPEPKVTVEAIASDAFKSDKVQEIEKVEEDKTTIIPIKEGDIFMNNWEVYEITDEYILFKDLSNPDLMVKKYMIINENKGIK